MRHSNALMRSSGYSIKPVSAATAAITTIASPLVIVQAIIADQVGDHYSVVGL